MALPLWLSEKLWMADDIRDRLENYRGEVSFGEHHESHAASAFYPSPFEQAAIVTPPPTSVRQPLAEMGRMAVSLLLRLIENQRLEGMNVELQTRLVVRESTAPPRR